MKRRAFFNTLGKAIAGFSVLPAATTYARKWKRTENVWQANPEWVDAPYEVLWVYLLGADGSPIVFKRPGPEELILTPVASLLPLVNPQH